MVPDEKIEPRLEGAGKRARGGSEGESRGKSGGESGGKSGGESGGEPRKPRKPVWQREREKLDAVRAKVEAAAGRAIDAIVPTARDSSRASVKVGGQVIATLQAARVAELGLVAGRVLDDALAERLVEAAVSDRAQQRALMKLNRRALSEAELRRKLREEGFGDTMIDPALDRLRGAGLVDDEAYGRAVLAALTRGKPAGPRLMQAKLREKGVPGPLAERLVAEAEPERDEQLDGAVALVTKRVASMQRLDHATRYRRLLGLLLRRGFDHAIARAAVDRALGSGEDEAGGETMPD